MISVKNLTKKYQDKLAVDSISFDVEMGNIIGFLGPNGAGKTTTMRILSGYMPPTEGTALVENINVLENPLPVKRIVGYLPEDNPLYGDLTPIEYLEFCAKIRKMGAVLIKKRIKDVVNTCGLSKVAVQPIATLSKGYRQRVGIAQAILHDPSILILDEPTSGLDPNQIQEIRSLITGLKKEKTIIISTHIMQEVQALCQRVIIINNGKLVADGTPQELTGSTEQNVFSVQLDGPENEIFEKFTGEFGVAAVSGDGNMFCLKGGSGFDPRRKIFQIAAEKNWPILTVVKMQRRLEEVFKELTSEKTDE